MVEIETWLDSLPYEVICVFSARCVLRAIPGEMRRHEKIEVDRNALLMRFPEAERKAHQQWYRDNRPIVPLEKQMYPRFIRACLTLYAGIWPNRLNDLLLEDAAGQVKRHRTTSYRLAAASLEYAAHDRAAHAAAAGYGARTVMNWDCGIVGSLERCQRIEEQPTSHELSDLTLCEDAIFIREGGTALELAKRPLWTDIDDFPNYWFGEYWLKMKARLLALEQDWEVWTSWYEAILYGTWPESMSERTELGLDGSCGRMTLPGHYYDDVLRANRQIKKTLRDAVEGLSWSNT